MANNEFFEDPSPATDWQLLGKFELANDTNEESLHTRIIQTLNTLELPPDFLKRVLESMEDSIQRILQAEVDAKHERIHLFLFASSYHSSKEQTWGFFRIEKIENSIEEAISHDQTIEFYLYVEGTSP